MSKKQIVPLVGITGFGCVEDVLRMQTIWEIHKRPDSKRLLHVGLMTGPKQLEGLPNKFDGIWLSKEKFAGVFRLTSDQVYNCVHYADYANFSNNLSFRKHLQTIVESSGNNLHGIQLDMIWPNPEELEPLFNGAKEKVEIILQVGRKAFDLVNNDPKQLVSKLEEYEPFIDRVLLDKSMGEGLGLDAEAMIPFLEEIRGRFPDMGLIVVGGLSADTFHLLEPLRDKFFSVSIDAEGGTER